MRMTGGWLSEKGFIYVSSRGNEWKRGKNGCVFCILNTVFFFAIDILDLHLELTNKKLSFNTEQNY